MLSLEEIKASKYSRILFGHYINQLAACFNGYQKAHEMLTYGIDEDYKKTAIWNEYNDAFDENILSAVIGILEESNCGLAESCVLIFKMLDRVAEKVEELEKTQQNDAYWGVKYGRTSLNRK